MLSTSLNLRESIRPGARQGWLDKQAKDKSCWKRRYVVLADDQVTYAREAGATACKTISVPDISVIRMESEDSKMFRLRTPEREYRFRAASRDDLFEWLHMMHRAIVTQIQRAAAEKANAEQDVRPDGAAARAHAAFNAPLSSSVPTAGFMFRSQTFATSRGPMLPLAAPSMHGTSNSTGDIDDKRRRRFGGVMDDDGDDGVPSIGVSAGCSLDDDDMGATPVEDTQFSMDMEDDDDGAVRVPRAHPVTRTMSLSHTVPLDHRNARPQSMNLSNSAKPPILPRHHVESGAGAAVGRGSTVMSSSPPIAIARPLPTLPPSAHPTLAPAPAAVAAAAPPAVAPPAPAPAPAPAAAAGGGRWISPRLAKLREEEERKRAAAAAGGITHVSNSASTSPVTAAAVVAVPSPRPTPIAKRAPHGHGEHGRFFGTWSAQNKRDHMEDAHVAHEDMLHHMSESKQVHGSSHCSVYGVFDGHMGRCAADFAADRIPKLMVADENLLLAPGSTMRTAFEACDLEFRKLHEANLHGALAKDYRSGSTALVVMLMGNLLHVANLGDCRAIVCRTDSAPTCLTVDHTPAVCATASVVLCDDGSVSQSETERIESAGGWVTVSKELIVNKLRQLPAGSQSTVSVSEWTVTSYTCGELSVSRSIGDAMYKGDCKSTFEWAWPTGHPHEFKGEVLLSTPDIFTYELAPEDDLLLLACDGVWESLNIEEAANLVTAAVRKEGATLTDASCRLVQLAIERGSLDNVTVMLVDLRAKRNAGSETASS